MNTLFLTHAQPQFLPRIILDKEEIICGPHYNNLKSKGRWRFINAPSGVFDISPLLQKIPQQQQPDFIFVHVDATLGCLPQNLPAHATKVLLIGDTHHLAKPIQNILLYAASVDFDAIILWNRQHAHFFTEFGFENVFWIPGLSFSIPQVPQIEEKKNQLCFFGQMGPYHPRRSRYIEALQKANIPLVGGKLPRMESLELVSQSTLSLNITLNSEWNLRVFETAQNGTLLITDKLSDKTGLEIFYPDGDAIVTYQSIDELLQRIAYFAENTELASTIGKRAKAITEEYFSLKARKQAIFALLNNETTLDVYRLAGETRCQLPKCSVEEKDAFTIRLQTYEWLQEKHRSEESLTVIHSPETSIYAPSDIADLIRVKQLLWIDKETFDSVWDPAISELGIMNLKSLDPEEWPNERPNLLITTVAGLDNVQVQEVIRAKKSDTILISDFHINKDVRIERAMLEFGYQTNHASVFGMFIPSMT